MKFAAVATINACTVIQVDQIPDVLLIVKQPSVTIPATINYTALSGATLTVSWGDGTNSVLTGNGALQSVTKNYSASGTFRVNISGDLNMLTAFLIGGEIWNVDITELGKFTNLTYLDLRPQVQTIVGDIGVLKNIHEIWMPRPLTPGESVYGSLDNCPALTVFECQGALGNEHVINVTGDFAKMTHLVEWCAVTKCTGDITALDLHYMSWGYGLGDSMTGTIQPTDLPVRIWGDMSNMVNLWYWALNAGGSTITGDCALLANIEWFATPRISKPASLASMPKLCYFIAKYDWVLTEAEVNQYLADIWANREVPRSHYVNTNAGGDWTKARGINIGNNVLSSAPTGQGLIDKANLQATVSPAVPGDGVAWTIQTR